jgi:hypothetical protein
MVIEPKNEDTRWITLDVNDRIVSEGRTPEEAMEKANGKKVFLMYIGERNVSWTY